MWERISLKYYNNYELAEIDVQLMSNWEFLDAHLQEQHDVTIWNSRMYTSSNNMTLYLILNHPLLQQIWILSVFLPDVAFTVALSGRITFNPDDTVPHNGTYDLTWEPWPFTTLSCTRALCSMIKGSVTPMEKALISKVTNILIYCFSSHFSDLLSDLSMIKSSAPHTGELMIRVTNTLINSI